MGSSSGGGVTSAMSTGSSRERRARVVSSARAPTRLAWIALLTAGCGRVGFATSGDGQASDGGGGLLDDGAPGDGSMGTPTNPVMRIGVGGVHSSKIVDPTNASSITSSIARPTADCGGAGTLAERLADCAARNVGTSSHGDGVTASWSLLSRRSSPTVEVWRDNLSGLVWSDGIGTQSTNWCHASGANNKPGSPWAEDDPQDLCDGVNAGVSGPLQSQTAPISLCGEDPVHLDGITTTDPGKSTLGILAGATTSLSWRLPEFGEIYASVVRGAGRVLPSLGLYWSSLVSNNRAVATIVVLGSSTNWITAPRDDSSTSFRYGVRCVAQTPRQPGDPPSPACPSATPLSLGTPVQGTTSTNSIGGASCGLGGVAAPDRTFTFTAPSAGTYEFDSAGSSFDTVVYARAGDCQGAELACTDDGTQPGTAAKIAVSLSAGEPITVVLDGYATAAGAFSIVVTRL